MKLLAFFLLVGVASASFVDGLEETTNEGVESFTAKMDQVVPLMISLSTAGEKDIDEAEAEIKTELGKQLKKKLDWFLEKIVDDMEKSRTIKADISVKIRDIREKLRALKLDMGENSKELFRIIMDKAKDFMKKLLEKLKTKKRSLEYSTGVVFSEPSIREVLQQLKKQLLEKMDKEEIVEKIKKILGQGSELLEQFIKTLKEKGKQKLIDLIDHLLGEYTDRRQRSLSELWERVKDYFKDLHIDLKVKFLKFGEWIKETIGNSLESSKDKFINIKAIAKEFVKHIKGVSKEIASEALEFFRQYKDELGDLWTEVKDAVNDVLNNN